MQDVAVRILDWYETCGRKDLPWQKTPTAYRVWVSEIMLQQTQVATVIPYYKRFMASFPEVRALADADADDVLHHWSGLGYYARARNLHRAARVIRDQYDGEFPSDFDEVVNLPGIGRSTAGAILALSQGQRHPILDGNVKRVLCRYHAIGGWPGKTSVANELWQRADEHTPAAKVAPYTQAIMDLGATLCTRSNPDCPRCPLATGCRAHAAGRETDYPGRRPKKDKPRKSTCMLLAHRDGELYLERRPPAGIWGGLWSLPEVASENDAEGWVGETLHAAINERTRWAPLTHSFSHYDLDIQPLEVRVDAASRTVNDRDGRWFSLAAPPQVGLAAPVRKLLDELLERGTT